MCLAIPMRVISIDGQRAVVEQGGAQRTISIALLDEVKLQQYVLVHAGYAIARVDEDEARKTLELIEQLMALLDPASVNIGGGAGVSPANTAHDVAAPTVGAPPREDAADASGDTP